MCRDGDEVPKHVRLTGQRSATERHSAAQRGRNEPVHHCPAPGAGSEAHPLCQWRGGAWEGMVLACQGQGGEGHGIEGGASERLSCFSF